MSLSQRLLSSSARLTRSGRCLGQAQWRQTQQQAQRQFSLQSRPAHRGLSPKDAHKTQQRYASTAAKDVKSAGTRTKNLIYGTGLLVVLMRSDEVRGILTDLVRRALTVA